MSSSETRLRLDDATFKSLLPPEIQKSSERFFTPAWVAIKSSQWLSGMDNREILDIGAGAGKFCLFGSRYTKSKFVGVEARKQLVDTADNIFKIYEIKGVKMVCSDILDFPISEYSAFYYYNPFQENIAVHLRMDDKLNLSMGNYQKYISYTRVQMAKAKEGSRLVTYHGDNFQVPNSYNLVEEHESGYLKFWIKTS